MHWRCAGSKSSTTFRRMPLAVAPRHTRPHCAANLRMSHVCGANPVSSMHSRNPQPPRSPHRMSARTHSQVTYTIGYRRTRTDSQYTDTHTRPHTTARVLYTAVYAAFKACNLLPGSGTVYVRCVACAMRMHALCGSTRVRSGRMVAPSGRVRSGRLANRSAKRRAEDASEPAICH